MSTKWLHTQHDGFDQVSEDPCEKAISWTACGREKASHEESGYLQAVGAVSLALTPAFPAIETCYWPELVIGLLIDACMWCYFCSFL